MKLLIRLYSYVRRTVSFVHMQMIMAIAFVASFVIAALPVSALAVETETETKVKEVATKVGEEGVVIVLAILTALVALLVAVIIIPKAIALIRRFV